MNYALQYLSVVCATSLVMLDISKATDEYGAELEPRCEMTNSVAVKWVVTITCLPLLVTEAKIFLFEVRPSLSLVRYRNVGRGD